MTANENFGQLTDRVNEAQAKVKAAATYGPGWPKAGPGRQPWPV